MSPFQASTAAHLETLAARAAETLGADIASLMAYGDGEDEPAHQELSALVVLERATSSLLEALASVFRETWRELDVDPFVLTRSELPRLADVFPLKLRHIQTHGVLLHGEDLVSAVPVEREHLRLRLEQSLRNHVLRLRRRFLTAAGDERALRATLAANAPGLAVEMDALTHVLGTEGSGGPAIATDVLSRLRALRRGEVEPDARVLYGRLLDLLERAVEMADRAKI